MVSIFKRNIAVMIMALYFSFGGKRHIGLVTYTCTIKLQQSGLTLTWGPVVKRAQLNYILSDDYPQVFFSALQFVIFNRSAHPCVKQFFFHFRETFLITKISVLRLMMSSTVSRSLKHTLSFGQCLVYCALCLRIYSHKNLFLEEYFS